MNAMERVASILEKNLEVIKDLAERVEALERDQDNTQEELRGLIVDVGQHTEELAAFRMEIDELAAEVEVALCEIS
jgi:hypothetical protein